MRVQTRYSVGDIVKYFNNSSNNYEIGRIDCIYVTYSVESSLSVKYEVEKILFDKKMGTSNSKLIEQFHIIKKIHKKAFEKEYAKECAREAVRKVLQNDKMSDIEC